MTPPESAPLRPEAAAALATPIWWTSIIAAMALIGAILVFGRDVMIPIAVAVLIWSLINGIARGYGRVRVLGLRLPARLCMLASLATIIALCWIAIDIVASNVAQVSIAAPAYEENFRALTTQLTDFVGPERVPPLQEMLGRIDLASLIGRLSAAMGALVGNAGLVALYVMFLLFEQSIFDRKLDALFAERRRRDRLRHILTEIEARIERYLWIKTLVSALTAILCYGVLWMVDVDYAGFWALCVFLFNFIPNIGSLFAVVLPALLALLQFGSISTFLLVLGSLSAIQVLVGNFVEPRLMGSSLNLSPLVIILSLTLWGSIWGIAGMFLCVPLTVILVIICSQFEATRPVAILLSSNGEVGE